MQRRHLLTAWAALLLLAQVLLALGREQARDPVLDELGRRRLVVGQRRGRAWDAQQGGHETATIQCNATPR